MSSSSKSLPLAFSIASIGAGEQGQHAGQLDAAMDLGLLDVDQRLDRLAHGVDVEVQPVARSSWRRHGSRRPGICSLSLWILAAMRRCASSRPSLCGRSTSIGRSMGGKMRRSSLLFNRQRVLMGNDPPARPDPADAVCRRRRLAQAPHWNPAAEYVTAGQDEPGYRAWVAQASWRPVYVKAFHDYLVHYGVGGVAPTWQLLRTATDWQKCGAQPFEVPPTDRLAEHRRRAALCRRLRHAADRPGRGGVGLSQPAAQRLRRRRAGKHASLHGRGRHGAAAPDHPRGADDPAVPDPPRQRRADLHRPRLLQGPALPHRRQEVSRMGHGWAPEAAIGCAAVLAEGAAPFSPPSRFRAPAQRAAPLPANDRYPPSPASP